VQPLPNYFVLLFTINILSGYIKPQRKRIEQHLENRPRGGNVDSRVQVQLEEDRDGIARQSWMETSGL